MNYTPDQEEALTNMIAWTKTEPEATLDYLYTLNGAAGTGKTTITKAFLSRLKIGKSKVAVTAPTHKAKKEIQKATDYVGQTIQKLLGLRPDMNMKDFDINDPKFRVLGKDLMKLYKYVLIDESSMLNADSFKLICEQAKKHKIRVVFLGDSFQLPPVNEKISKVFSTVKNQSTLTTMVRQGDDNPMTSILQLLRKDIVDGTQHGIEAMTTDKQIVIGDKGFKCLPSKADPVFGDVTFGKEMLLKFMSTEYTVDKNYIKFIAYTNDTVVKWSELLRLRLLGEDAENLINKGEVLTGYSSITDYKTNTAIIATSEDYTVESSAYILNTDSIKGYNTRLVNEKGNFRTVFIVNHLDEENLQRFRDIAIPLLQTAINRRGRYWTKWYEFKHANLLLVDTYKDPNAAKSRHNLLCKKDLYYGYGVTVHKSQGSTYTYAAINMVDLYTNYDESERARLIYVALSRCRNMNLILVK